MADDDEGGVWSGGEIYQLRVVIAGISPLIWRRLLVAADTTIAELHTILQTVFGWSGEHLHRFVIHGTDYGISYAGSEGFRDDARTVRLEDLGLRLGERFSYEYNYFAAWTCDLRLEQIQAGEPGRMYPRCIGGRRAAHPRNGTGPGLFWNGPSSTWCSRRSDGRRRSWVSSSTPTKTPSSPTSSASITTSSALCCRC
jgi:hypothetical protein